MNFLSNTVIFTMILVGQLFLQIALGLRGMKKFLVATMVALGLTSSAMAFTPAEQATVIEAKEACQTYRKVHRLHLERFYSADTKPKQVKFHDMAIENLELARPYCSVWAQSYQPQNYTVK